MTTINKVINPGKFLPWYGSKRMYNVYIHIKFDGKNLSITGVEGPLSSGNCMGGCGQINMSMNAEYLKNFKYNDDWNSSMMQQLLKYWDIYHLNSMQSTCEHQRNRGETWKSHPLAVCPDCSYKLGTSWLYMEVPESVINWLNSLPDSKNVPAWV